MSVTYVDLGGHSLERSSLPRKTVDWLLSVCDRGGRVFDGRTGSTLARLFAIMRWSCGRTFRSSCWRRCTRCYHWLTATPARVSVVTGSMCSGPLASGDTFASAGARSRGVNCEVPTCELSVTRAATTSTRSITGGSRCTSECSGTTAAESRSNQSNISTTCSNSCGQVNNV